MKLLTKNQNENRVQIQMLCIEDLVPENHLLRDIDKAIDFKFIYDLVKRLYCEDKGRPLSAS
jgi:transposase